MDKKYAELPEALRTWFEDWVGEMCQDDKFHCENLCHREGEPWEKRNCIILQAAAAIEELLNKQEPINEEVAP